MPLCVACSSFCFASSAAFTRLTQSSDAGCSRRRSQAQRLGHPDARVADVETVGAQALDPGPAQTVEEEIEQGHLPVIFPFALFHPEPEPKEKHQIPEAFVQKGGVDVNRVTGGIRQPHAAEDLRLAAEGLPVHEVAPAADDLADEHAENGQVQHGQEGELLAPGDQPDGQDPADDAPVDGDAPLPHREVGDEGTPRKLVQPEEHEIDPGAEDGERDQQDHHIVKIIGLQAEILAAPGAVEDAQGEAQGEEHPIEIDPVAENTEKGRGVQVGNAQPRKTDDGVPLDGLQHGLLQKGKSM